MRIRTIQIPALTNEKLMEIQKSGGFLGPRTEISSEWYIVHDGNGDKVGIIAKTIWKSVHRERMRNRL